MNSYINAMRHYFDFKGRATRSQFWLFTLFVFIFGIITITLDVALGFIDQGALLFTGILSLGHMIPMLSISARRLHDINKSGWWILISLTGIGQIILLIFYCLDSVNEGNKYGNALNQSNAQPADMTQAGSTSTIEQIEKLTALHNQGAIDEAEYKRLKSELLNKAG